MLKILVVTDASGFDELHRLLFENEGCEVVTLPDECKNYVDVLYVAYAERPDLIVTQSRFRRMDGYELCWRLKFDSLIGLTPIVTHVHPRDAEDFRRLVKHIIPMPAHPRDITKFVEGVLNP